MITKRECYCAVRETTVEAVVEESRKGKGKDAGVRHAFLRCSQSKECPKSTFCRFVNPLTTRNPLSLDTEKETAA